MRTYHERIFACGGSNNPVAGSLEVERKQLKNMRFVVNGQNQFICHVRILFLSRILAYLLAESPSALPGSKSASSLLSSSRKV